MSCKAPGLSTIESGIELTHCSSTATLDEDATSSELDLAEAYERLERMKQRVLQMKSIIIRSLQPESDEATTNDQHAGSDNVQLREVQQETTRAFEQIGQVKSRLKETIQELDILNERIQQSEQCTDKLAKKLDEVPKWMGEQQHQVALCLERHNDLDTTCCSYLDYSNFMRPLQVTLKNKFSSKVPLRCYEQNYTEITDHLTRTRNLMDAARDQLLKYTQIMDESLENAQKMPSLMLPDITDLAGLLEHSQQLGASTRPSLQVKTRTSFKFAWGGMPIKPTKKPLLTALSND